MLHGLPPGHLCEVGYGGGSPLQSPDMMGLLIQFGARMHHARMRLTSVHNSTILIESLGECSLPIEFDLAQDGTQDGLGSFVYNSRKKGEEIGKPDSVPFPNKER